MKPQEQAVIDHATALIKNLTTCMKPVYKENKFFMSLSVGYGDTACKVNYDKQTNANPDLDNVKMSLYVLVLGLIMEEFSKGKLPGLVEYWKREEAEQVPEGERPHSIVFNQDELASIVYNEAVHNTLDGFIEKMNAQGLFITETER